MGTMPVKARGLRVITLNVWGLPDLPLLRLTPHRTERMRHIARELRRQAESPQGWDMILLQEAWLGRDRERLKDCGYPYCLDLDDPRKPVDSGLLILSRFPVETGTAARIRFSRGGHIHRSFGDGEFLSTKSGILARVTHPLIGSVWVANTHLIANYPGRRGDIYLEHRKTQLRELVSWALDRTGGEPLVIGGDFNFGPGSEEWEELWRLIPSFTEAPDAALICTLDRACARQSGRDAIPGGYKIDHLFASRHFRAVAGGLAFDEPMEIDDGWVRVSDHFGFETRFQFLPTP